jgi:hypothetical protein
MEISNILIVDHYLDQPDLYVKQVLEGEFQDVHDGEKIFRGIQISHNEEVEQKILSIFSGYEIVHNFIRQSPANQDEPNYIHSDKNMCDTIAILYLNQDFPKDAGTTIHENKKTNSIVDRGEQADEFNKSIVVSMKYNRLVAFPADLYHSRNLLNNFGSGNQSRLIQVMFLNRI